MRARTLKRSFPWRLLIQIAFFLLIAFIAVNHSLATIGASLPVLSTASLHAICPFGGVVSVYQLVTDGTFVKKVHSASLILMGIVFFLSILFGPVFCGWACPFGSIQEWIGMLGKRIFGRMHNRIIPKQIDTALRYLRYVVLAWVVYMTAATGTLVFEKVDPYWALFNFWTGEVAIAGFVILGVTFILSLLIERPFCKYACPYGALLGLTNFVRVFRITRNKTTCTSCKACDRACPMNITVSNKGSVRNHQCISCLECTSEKACPVPRTVSHAAGRLVPPRLDAPGLGGEESAS